METRTRRSERREEPLSRELIVQAAVELLDASGERGLTFRALAERLATGPGAIYWHITGKDEVLGAATDAVVADAMSLSSADATPQEAVRALALGVFDAIDAHPWVGTQLARAPWQSAMLRVFERIGRLVRALGVPPSAEFTSASALFNYILGVGGQNAANARAHEPGATRAEFLDNVSVAWAELDPDEYAFIRSAADRLREHDDRTEFLAGLDLILSGITATLL
ncbi:TetR/AcrR family transcriptional regulator [Streptomyces sp. NBC_01750]|uniref:TetR/AcrR family transcriptional regulator n=1 Tax=Streptomyces sp. NBC_01750 TaxID=2975928 RepID=UPI002DD8136A|nr:TetR/AcrR family transcriptional regulator [Streptomyces sp. NBC_01750]WSD30910.1 TetR/AcrR family transcriptional regulator [Streptomyces sp. NBC_01750]